VIPPLLAQSHPAELGGLAGWVVDVIDALGLLGVGILTLLENLFPPIPSEVVLPLAGFLAGRGRMSFLGALMAATVGSMVGAWLLYWVGGSLGLRRVEALARRLPLVEDDDVQRANSWFDRHGAAAVFIGRFVPGVRSVVSVPAGIRRMDLRRFTAYTLVGSLGWNASLITLGWVLGNRWERVDRWADLLDYAIVAAVVVVVARFGWSRRDRMRRRPRQRQLG
jgi:membrane protein DedA with SNARE-associated domain